MKENKNIILVFLGIALFAIIWKLAKTKEAESGYFGYVNGSWYIVKPWHDNWPAL